MFKKTLILLESNYSYLLSLLHLYDPKEILKAKKIIIFSKLKKTTNLRLFSILLRKYRYISSKKDITSNCMKWFIKIFHNFLYVLFSIYILLVLYLNNITTIYTTTHTFTGCILLRVLKKMKKKSKVIIVDDGLSTSKKSFFKENTFIEFKDDIDLFIFNENNKYCDIKQEEVKIFCKNIDLSIINNIFNYKKINNINTLLVTQPFVIDGYIKSYKEKNKLYNDILKKYCNSNEMIYVKQHPREVKKIHLNNNKNLKFIYKNIPLELFVLNGVKINKLITVNSTCYKTLENNVNEIIVTNDINI